MNIFKKQSPEEQQPPAVQPMNGPAGIDVHPKPGPVPRISRTLLWAAGIVAAIVVASLLLDNRKIAAEAAVKLDAPSGAANPQEVTQNIKPGLATLAGKDVPPKATEQQQQPTAQKESEHAGAPPPVLHVARASFPGLSPLDRGQWMQQPVQVQHDDGGYRAAMMAPTSIRGSAGSTASFLPPVAAPQLAAPVQTAMVRQPPRAGVLPMTEKEAFIDDARHRADGDYLPAVRTPPLSPYEIKAGWEIPAVLETAINSDLPGETKCRVRENVYDTATGQSLLIPQNSRVVGKYDSRVGYGQDGVQVVWDRVIYPDGSSLDIDGMVGMDSQGNAGLRDKVDRHYKRLLGFAGLTSLFNAAFALTQRSTYSGGNYMYPSAAQVTGTAVGQGMSQTGNQIAQKNINVPPTIKVPPGYKFNVRVNRDIVFDAPYR